MHHVSRVQPFPVQFLQLFEALAVAESLPASCSPSPSNRNLYTKAAIKANPKSRIGSRSCGGKIVSFQPLRRADGSNLFNLEALAAAVVAASIVFQARSRIPESPVATSSAASGTAMRSLSGTGPQTIMKKS